ELVDGVDHHRVLAFFRREIEGPRTERKATKVLTERRRGPRLSAISGDLHRAYAVAAIPGDAAHGQLAGIDFGTVTVAGDQRIYNHFSNRRAGRVFLAGETVPERKFADRHAIGRVHPEAALRPGQCVDGDDVLHPVCPGPAGDNDASRKAVPVRE